MVFWNVVGLGKKDADFWKFLRGFEVIELIETWVEQKAWKKLEKKLPKEYKWKCKFAKKEQKRGTASGGIITGVKKEIAGESRIADSDEELVENTVKLEEDLWEIWTVDNRRGVKKIIKGIGEDQRHSLIVGEDFNARTGNKGRWYLGEEEEMERRSRDKKCDAKGELLIKEIEEEEWYMLNGNTKGDKNGGFTFVSQVGQSVIDYILVNDVEEIKDFQVIDRIKSDLMPITCTFKKKLSKEKSREGEEETGEEIIWDEESKVKFQLAMINGIYNENDNVERKWEKVKQTIYNGMSKKVWKRKENSIGRKKWWDKECSKKKRKVKKELKKYKKGKLPKELYLKEKRNVNTYARKKKMKCKRKNWRRL